MKPWPSSLAKEGANIIRQANSAHNASADAASDSTRSAHGPGLDKSENMASKRRKLDVQTLMEYCYRSDPQNKRYRQRLHKLWIELDRTQNSIAEQRLAHQVRSELFLLYSYYISYCMYFLLFLLYYIYSI